MKNRDAIPETSATQEWKLAPMKEPLTCLDLFSGCGGFTLGMLRAGFRCLASIDFNQEAVDTLELNLIAPPVSELAPVEHVLLRDLTTFKPIDLARLIGVEVVDVIVGGPPCQGFSTARQRDGSNHGMRLKDDNRRLLYRHFLEYVEFFQPKAFVMENVLGMRTAAGGQYFTAVQHEARNLGRSSGDPGYRVHSQIEYAHELGVPQKRRRQLIIGIRADIPAYFDPRVQPAPRARRHTNLGDCLLDLPPLAAGQGVNDCSYDCDLRAKALARKRAQVSNYLTSVLEVQFAKRLANHASRSHSDRDLRDFRKLREGENAAAAMRRGVRFEFPYDKSTFKDRYTRQHRRRPCSTIVAHLSKDGLMFIHPTQDRSLTPREAARIQSFPDWFVFPEARTHAFRMIGNAVPPLIAEAVGLAVSAHIRKYAFGTTPLRAPRTVLAELIEATTSRAVAAAISGTLSTISLTTQELRDLSNSELLLRWNQVLAFLPDLHPINSFDHGTDITDSPIPELVALGLPELAAPRYQRSGWPVALASFAAEVSRRFATRRIRPEAIYCTLSATVDPVARLLQRARVSA